MPKANKCLEELETKNNYDLKGENLYQVTSQKSIPVAGSKDKVFASKIQID